MNFRKYLFEKTVTVENKVCLKQIFHSILALSNYLSWRVSWKSVYPHHKQNLQVYIPLKEKTSEPPSNRVNLSGWGFFESCCLRELYDAQHVDQRIKGEIYSTEGGKSSKNPLGSGKVSLTEKQMGHSLCCYSEDPRLTANLQVKRQQPSVLSNWNTLDIMHVFFFRDIQLYCTKSFKWSALFLCKDTSIFFHFC